MKRQYTLWVVLLVAALLLAACQPAAETEAPGGATEALPEPTEAMEEPTVAMPEATEAMEEPTETAAEPTEAMEEPTGTAPAAGTATEPASEGTAPVPVTGEVVFFSTQFSPVEEQEKFRTILEEGGFDVNATEEGPLIDMVLAGAQAGQGEVDAIGALHGTFPPLQDNLMNMIDVADDLSADREFTQSFLETGLLGTDDTLYYIPWMQATYIMAARSEAMEFLPEGADVNALTWDQLAEWCQALLDETGGPKCGLPHAGLFHRFLQGYLWPSFTGGMVTQFKSPEAAEMLEWARDVLWPTIHPQSISYEFMQEPLQAGEVWVAFDHTARLIEALNADPENYVAFPAPAGPAGRGYMPVVAGLGIPQNAPNPEGAIALIDYLTRPEIQARVLRELAFFPVVADVDMSDLPEGVALEAGAVDMQTNSPDALPALLPVGLGERGGEINQIFRNAFDQVVINGEDAATVLETEGANLEALMSETGAACWAPDPASDGPCPVE
jgi:multiple sugar transport system substrate-binding protein